MSSSELPVVIQFPDDSQTRATLCQNSVMEFKWNAGHPPAAAHHELKLEIHTNSLRDLFPGLEQHMTVDCTKEMVVICKA